MKHSTERILTTHAGSLPRPADLVRLVAARAAGEAIDERAYAGRLRQAVGEIVRKQADLGIDVVDDGEFGKPSFVSYAQDRLAGYELKAGGERRNPWLASREAQSFPKFYQAAAASVAASHAHLVCTGPLAYRGEKLLKTDLDNLKAAMAETKTKVAEAFVPSVSPATVEDWNRNEYYKSAEDYVFAIAEAMRVEYRAIVDAGFLLQVDDPRLLTYYIMHPEKSVAECRSWAELRVQALNHALADIPREKIRYHTCYGINIGPRIHDLELKDIVDIMLGIKAGGYSFEASNPRHEHEWRVWKEVKLPPGSILIPGVITHSTVLVEHPELVAERIVKFAQIVGRENVIAGSDCGFATFAGADEIQERIVWAKFAALAQGAQLASKQLWGGA